MSEQDHNEKPEVYALHQDGGSWQISRRDFLKAAGIGAAALGMGLNSKMVRPASAADSLETLCKESPAHDAGIEHLALSAEGKYLLSASDSVLKCWDFENYSLLFTRKVSKIQYLTAGMVGGNSCAVYVLNGEKVLRVLTLPDIKGNSERKIDLPWSGSAVIRDVIADREGNLYVLLLDQSNLNHKSWFILKVKTKAGNDPFDGYEKIYTSDEEIVSFALMDHEKKLLIADKEPALKLVDTEEGTAEALDIPALNRGRTYAVRPGGTAVLFAGDAGYGLASLSGKSMIWEQKVSLDIRNTLITPDGGYGILLAVSGKESLHLIGMNDGLIAEEVEFGSVSDSCYDIAAARDGSKIAVANDRSILFFSLPDLKVIGCPVDLSEMKDNVKGIEVSGTDPVTGRTVTYTLPCGAPIPAGAVCTCNCVAGSIPSCSCVGHKTCSCVGHCSCNSQGSHYWHPN